MGGESFFSSPQVPSSMGEGEETFVPSKMGYLHIKNQVQQRIRAIAVAPNFAVKIHENVSFRKKGLERSFYVAKRQVP